MSVPCKQCGIKRAKRFCPGVGAEICPTCCGSERENTVDCPLECEFLQESRRHEHQAALAEGSVPNLDVKITESFVQRMEPVLMFLGFQTRDAMAKAGATDWDAREALASLIQSYRTAQSGLIYEARTPNPFAAAIQESLKASIAELGKMLVEQQGMETLRDADVIGCLVFLQRLELQHNNGRRKSRAFLDFLRTSLSPPPDAPIEKVPEPRVQLS